MSFDTYIQAILSNLPNSIYWKDINGVYLGANIHAARMVGLTSVDDLIDKTDYDLTSKDMADKFRENDAIVLTTGKEICVEEISNSKDGNLIQLSTKKPIKDNDGNIIGVMGMTVDITHLKAKEKMLLEQAKLLEEALSEKTRFLNNLSHEMRIPLHVIMAISEELHNNIDYLSQEEVKSFLSTLLQNNKRLLELVTNLLDLAKSKQRKSSYRFEKKNIVTTIHETISEFGPVSSIALKTDHDKILASIDELKIFQVMRNIVNNAMKYGDKDSITVELKQLKTQKSVMIKVKNKGIGILAEEREKVFEPFFQGSKTRTQAGGTGLGLSICKEIIFAHKGSIWIDQDESDMTSVNFTIPYIEQ
jgi:PAS domain S-box-containing protein